MGVVASYTPATKVIINGVSAALFPINYMPQGIEQGMGITGFRATLFLNGNSPVRVVATDSQGNVRDAAYLPDDSGTLQRLQYWVSTAPGDPFASLRFANARAWIGDMTTALPIYDRFIASQPSFLAGRQLRALAQMDMGFPDKAIDDLNFIVNAASDVFPPRLDLALALYQTGDVAGAVAQYQQVLALRPDLAEVHLALGRALADMGNVTEASFQQQQAAQGAPTMSDATFQYGVNQAQEGDYGQALYTMRRAVQQNPRSGQAYLALALIRYQRGEYGRAWQAVDRAQRWGASPDPNFLAALNLKQPRPYSIPRPRNYTRPGG
jgi:tetratricopeptide (TPR) repeat protein